jgi:hypothetical protein
MERSSAPLFWSSFDADVQRAVLRASGFELALDCVESTIEEGRPHPFFLVAARRPKGEVVLPDGH